MNQKNIVTLLIPMIVSLLTVSGCKKLVEVGNPETKLIAEKVFEDGTTATSAQLAIYAQMVSNGESFKISQQCGLLADELKNYSRITSQIQFYTNSLNATTTFGIWTNAYNYIYQANAIVQALQANNPLTESIKKQLIGESEFIRAFWYFYLVNLYGDVPLTTSTDYSKNSQLARSGANVVYHQIVSDLLDARIKLNTNYVDVNDTTTTTERIRPTRWAASALLARTYLYMKRYDSADFYASEVINNAELFEILPSLDDVFLANSREAIWQLGIPTPNSANTPDGRGFILTSAPATGTSRSTTISEQLDSAFEDGDSRQSNWISNITRSSGTYYFPFKYKVSLSTDITEYVMVLRLAEQYLIRAEARTQEGNTSDGLKDLNIIRRRANLDDYTGPTDQSTVIDAILHERQVELFAEWGHRWLDLIRTTKVGAVLGAPGNICQWKGGLWSQNWIVFPIPQTERTADPNLGQNTGY